MDIIGPLQLRVMHYIWQEGASTVHEVHDALNNAPNAPKLAYTTILTVMRNLARREILLQKPAGRSHMFSAEINETDYKASLLGKICSDFFNGDSSIMIEMLRKERQEQPSTAE